MRPTHLKLGAGDSCKHGRSVCALAATYPSSPGISILSLTSSGTRTPPFVAKFKIISRRSSGSSCNTDEMLVSYCSLSFTAPTRLFHPQQLVLPLSRADEITHCAVFDLECEDVLHMRDVSSC